MVLESSEVLEPVAPESTSLHSGVSTALDMLTPATLSTLLTREPFKKRCSSKKNLTETNQAPSSAAMALLLPSAGHCKVHPSVIFTILDHHSRRKEGQDRVIGTLLGVKTDNVIKIQNCFAVPHNENEEQVAVDMDFHHNMFKLHKQVNSREEVVGWYATGSNISEHSAVIHGFYSNEGAQLHLLVDATINPETPMSARAFVSSPVSLGEQALGVRFQELCTEVVSSDVSPSL